MRLIPRTGLALARATQALVAYRANARRLQRAVRRARAEPLGPPAWGYRIFSQHGEDGVLAAIFDRIGVGPRKFVEFGFGVVQNNSLAFAIQHQAGGVFVDGNERTCAAARTMFRLLRRSDIRVICHWLDAENVDLQIRTAIGSGDIDLLSIDVDGNDYWLWRSIVSVSPRVVVVEYNASFGPTRAVTVPYDPAFDRHEKHPSGLYHGMSLRAAEVLGAAKGYTLVGCDAAGVNAFFVRNDLLTDDLVKRSAETCFHPHRARIARGLTQKAQSQLAYSLPVVDV